MQQYIDKVLGLPFHQKLLIGAVFLVAGASGARYGDIGMPEGAEYLFIAMAAVCVLGAVYSHYQDRKIAANVENERQRADADIRVAKLEAGLPPKDDKTVIRRKPE